MVQVVWKIWTLVLALDGGSDTIKNVYLLKQQNLTLVEVLGIQ